MAALARGAPSVNPLALAAMAWFFASHGDRYPYVQLYAGRSYRYVGVLSTRAAVDVQELRRMLEVSGAREVEISTRAPHRVKFTMTSQYDARVKIGTDIPLTPTLAVRIESITPIARSSVLVG